MRASAAVGQQWRLTVSVARRVIVGRGRRGRRLVGLFMVPAFLISLAGFVVGALVLTPPQHAQEALGSADGLIRAVDEPYSDPSDFLAAATHPVAAHPIRYDYTQTIVSHDLQQAITLETADWRDPIIRSPWELVSGRWPVGADDVVLTRTSAKALSARPGDSIELAGRKAPARLVGIVESPTDFTIHDLLAAAPFVATVPNPSTQNVFASIEFLLTGSASDVARVVRAATQAGVASATRQQLMHEQAKTLFRTQALTVAAPGLLLVAVLSAAAFIVRVRRSGRQLAILLALGVRPVTLVRASRLAALSTGLLGATLGALLACLVSAAVSSPLGSAAGHRVGTPALSVGSILTTVLLVTLVGVGAAWLPARAARRGMARFDGSPPRARVGGRPSLVAAAALIGCVIAGIEFHSGTAAIAAFVVALVSASALVPVGLRSIAAGTARAPMLSRLAARQVSRDVRRPATAAAVGLVMMTGAVGCLVYYGSLLDLARAGDSGSTHYGVAAVPLRRVGLSASLVNDLRKTAGAQGRTGVVTDVVVGNVPRSRQRLDAGYYVEDSAGDGVGTLSEVESRDDFEGIAGRPPSAREWSALTSGHMLRLNGSAQGLFTLADVLPSDGPTVRTVEGDSNNQSISIGPAGPSTAPVLPNFTLSAVQSDPVADLAHTAAGFVVGPSLVHRLGLHGRASSVHVWEEGRVDAGLGARVQRVAQDHGIAASDIIFSSGALPPLPFDWQLVLIASTILLWAGVGLCVLAMSEDARPFYQSLFSLGFSVRRQRAVLAIQAGAIALVAVSLGAVTGLAVGVASVHAYADHASVTFALPRIGWLAVCAVAGSALIALLRPGQRAIDELL